MANNVAMRQMFERLAFSVEASTAAVEEESIADLDVLLDLKEEGVETLCKTMRRPGGTIPNQAIADHGH
jgi:hypothetical protein